MSDIRPQRMPAPWKNGAGEQQIAIAIVPVWLGQNVAVTPSYEENEWSEYALTHVATGLRVTEHSWANPRIAESVAEAIDGYAEWSRYEDSDEREKLRRKIERLIQLAADESIPDGDMIDECAEDDDHLLPGGAQGARR